VTLLPEARGEGLQRVAAAVQEPQLGERAELVGQRRQQVVVHEQFSKARGAQERCTVQTLKYAVFYFIEIVEEGSREEKRQNKTKTSHFTETVNL